MEIENIKDFHVHFYYSPETIFKAKSIAKELASKFNLSVGTFHERNVGPHPRWSVQLTVDKIQYADVLAWLSKNRSELTIFTHPNTGDDLSDHQDHAIWLGDCLKDELDLSIFK